jgi:hypothetical protein
MFWWCHRNIFNLSRKTNGVSSIFVLLTYWMHSLQNWTCACYQHLYKLYKHCKDSRLWSWIHMVLSWKFVMSSLSFTSHGHWTYICIHYLNSGIKLFIHIIGLNVGQMINPIKKFSMCNIQIFKYHARLLSSIWISSTRTILAVWIYSFGTISIFLASFFQWELEVEFGNRYHVNLCFHGIIFSSSSASGTMIILDQLCFIFWHALCCLEFCFFCSFCWLIVICCA